MQMNWDGFTQAQYESIRQTVHWEGNVPDGAVFHVAGFNEKGARVTDIWESAEQFNNFVQNRLMPACVAAGIPGEPHVDIYPMHAIFVPSPGNL
jgi:hypothetical protein